jgi:hypothetical protein
MALTHMGSSNARARLSDAILRAEKNLQRQHEWTSRFDTRSSIVTAVGLGMFAALASTVPAVEKWTPQLCGCRPAAKEIPGPADGARVAGAGNLALGCDDLSIQIVVGGWLVVKRLPQLCPGANPALRLRS